MFIRVGQFISALMIVLSFNAFAEGEWDEASAVIKDATEQVLSSIHNKEYSTDTEEGIEMLIKEMGAILDPVVDFPYISKLVMGKNYRRAPQAAQAQFADVFRHTLLKTYTKALLGFDIVSYEINPPRTPSPKPINQIVNVTVKSDAGVEYALVYYMTKKSGSWKLVNVEVDGLNIRNTFRGQFADLTEQNKGDVQAAVDAWAAHVSKNEVGAK
ncbi:MAG: MlaC/ttg2D family ABC transporter substrate-binding protein [Pontibacterium sp.]